MYCINITRRRFLCIEVSLYLSLLSRVEGIQVKTECNLPKVLGQLLGFMILVGDRQFSMGRPFYHMVKLECNRYCITLVCWLNLVRKSCRTPYKMRHHHCLAAYLGISQSGLPCMGRLACTIHVDQIVMSDFLWHLFGCRHRSEI